MEKSKSLLVIISKYPTAGNTKTRLGEVIGMDRAADLARAMLLDLIDNHLGQSYDLSLDTNETKYLRPLQQLVSPVPVRLVSGELLRGPNSVLLAVFTRHLQHYQKVIAVCADTPMVGKELVEGAFRDLNSYGVVLGHDLGPGYYLIGMNKLYDLFSPLKEGKDRRRPYYRETLALVEGLSLSHKLVESRLDVDIIDDLSQVKWSASDGNWARTIRLLHEFGLWVSS